MLRLCYVQAPVDCLWVFDLRAARTRQQARNNHAPMSGSVIMRGRPRGEVKPLGFRIKSFTIAMAAAGCVQDTNSSKARKAIRFEATNRIRRPVQILIFPEIRFHLVYLVRLRIRSTVQINRKQSPKTTWTLSSSNDLGSTR